jgi:conjugative transfer signal peptidase TraF
MTSAALFAPALSRRPQAYTITVARLALATAFASSLACILARHLLWNATASVPRGLYWLSRGSEPVRGKLVAFAVPASVRTLVRERQYLPAGAVLIKPVVATVGDQVCAEGEVVRINGELLAGGGRILKADRAGRPLPQYQGCGAMAQGEVFVASDHENSFDSRSFGPVSARDIQGTVVPVWTY